MNHGRSIRDIEVGIVFDFVFVLCGCMNSVLIVLEQKKEHARWRDGAMTSA